MPRRPAAKLRDRQLLLRLTSGELDLLQSIAHLDRKKPNGYAYDVLVTHLEGLRSNPRVQADMENRAAYGADRASSTPIRRSSDERPAGDLAAPSSPNDATA